MIDRVDLGDGLELSRIVYGMWRLGDDADTSPSHVQAKIEACLEQGITTLDQADIYGGYTAEALLGDCFKAAPSLRDQCEIITKCDIVAPMGRYASARVKYYDTSRDHILSSVETSLKEMAIDTIDLLLIHRPDPLMDHEETGSALDEVVSSGKVRAVGVSNFRPWDWTLLQSAMTTKLKTNQIEISLKEHMPFVNGDLAFLQERGIPAMAWSPLGGGDLVGSNAEAALRTTMATLAQNNSVDSAAIAIAWLLRHPAQIMPVMGTNNLDRIRAFSDALNVEMDREAWYELYTAALGREVA